MSANNGLFINKKTFAVYEHGCMDNGFLEKEASFIGRGKNVAEAVQIAEDYMNEEIVEYGVNFYN